MAVVGASIGRVPKVRLPVYGASTPTPSPTPSVQTRLLTAKRAAVVPEPVMSSPPTITNTGIGTVSSINGNSVTAPAVSPGNAAFTSIAGIVGDLGSGVYGAKYVTRSGVVEGACRGFGVAFLFTGQVFDFSCQRNAAGTQNLIRIRVNGQWTGGDFTLAGTGAGYVKVDFGSTVTAALIEIVFFAKIELLGFNLGGGASIAAATFPSSDLFALMFGDSYTAGAQVQTVRTGLAHALGTRFGIRNIIASGVSGQGWTASSDGNTFGQRITAGDVTRFPALDVIVLYGSVNDSGATGANIQTGAQAGLASIVASHPNAVKICISSFSSASSPMTNAQQDGARAGFQAAADANTVVLDCRLLGMPVIQGISGTDTNHPTLEESLGLSWFIADAVEMSLMGSKTGYIFTDDFNRANANLEASADWTRVDGTAGMMTVASNKLTCATTDSLGALYLCPDAGLSPQAVAYVPLAASGGPSVVCRATDKSNYVAMRYDSGNVLTIYSKTSGTTNSLASISTTANLSTDEYALEVIGGCWAARKNGALIGSGFLHLNVILATVAVPPYSSRQGVIARVAATAGWGDAFRRYVP